MAKVLPSGLLKIVGVCQGHLDYTARSCHFYSVVTTFTRLGKVPTLRAVGKRVEVTEELLKRWPTRHYGEIMGWAINEQSRI